MKKKIFAVLLCFSLFLISSCGKKEEAYETSYYPADILSEMKSHSGVDGMIAGLTEDLCVLPKEGFFDETLINAGNCGLFSEDTREVLYAKKAEERIYPASLTKCMTALVVLKTIDDLDQEVQVGDEMYDGLSDDSSMAELVKGASYSYRELLYALLVPSGNDAANTLAFHAGGSIEHFVEMMNAEAKHLCMVNTHYANPHGMHDEDHYTTVYDLYLLLNELKNYPEFQECSAKMTASISASVAGQEDIVQTYTSGNSYLRGYTVPPEGLNIVAAKTGYTTKAGRCLVLSLTDDAGNRYDAVLCNAETYDLCYSEMNAMLSIIGQ